MSSGPPVACEYENANGSACPNRAAVKLTIEQTGATSMTGEAVRYSCQSCHGHIEKAKQVPQGFRVVAIEPL